jgi:hypothetical protein
MIGKWAAAWRGHGLVEDHFAGANSTRRDRRMWQHLADCEPCRAQYHVHALCEASAGDGDAHAQARLARGIFSGATLAGGRPIRALISGFGLTALAAGVAALLLVPRLRHETLNDALKGTMAERGGAAEPAEQAALPAITIFRVVPPAPPARAGAVVHASEALAFAYTNPPGAGFSRLMIFAHDQAGHIYWYWPAWRDPATTPVAIPITPAAAPVELGEAVSHALQPGALTLTALFTDRAYDVRAIEAAVTAGPDALAQLSGRIVNQQVEVLP